MYLGNGQWSPYRPWSKERKEAASEREQQRLKEKAKMAKSPIDDTADAPVFVGAVFSTYADIGRAVSFALARGEHINMAPAVPQRGGRQLGLEGPQQRLALPAPARNGHAVNGKKIPVTAAILTLLGRGPLVRREIVEQLRDAYSPSNIAFGLGRIKKLNQVFHGGGDGDPYSINPNPPPTAGKPMKDASLQDIVFQIMTEHQGAPMGFADIRSRVSRKYTKQQIRQALERLMVKRKKITATGYRDARTYTLVAE
jgi:hypothetical protein